MKNYTWTDVDNSMRQIFPPELIAGTESLDDYSLVIFGAGNAGNIALKELCSKNISITAFCDNNEKKWGEVSLISGLPCISPDKLRDLENPFVLIAPIAYCKSMSDQLRAMGIRYAYADAIQVFVNYKKFKSIYDSYLNDARSKHVFSGLLLAKLSGNYSYCIDVYEECFYYALPSFKFLNPFEVMVDCGAFVGDTIQEIIERRNRTEFTRIYAFEPGELQFKALNARVNRLKEEWALLDEQIICIKSGVGSESKKAYLNVASPSTLNISTVTDECELGSEIDIVSLDEYFADKNDKISFIKADIEGSELQMLQGAQNIIKKYRPNIALSVYHKWDDLFELPEYIRSLVPEYKIDFRHHGPLFAETVCYCSVNEVL